MKSRPPSLRLIGHDLARLPSLRGIAAAVAVLPLLLGCGAEPGEDAGGIAPAPAPPEHGLVRERSVRRFARAAFLSPARDPVVGEETWLAPILVTELADGADAPGLFARFGELTRGPSGEAAVDVERPTVYRLTGAPEEGAPFGPASYLWFYPPAVPGEPVRWRGVRITPDAAGFPIAWEVLSSEAARRVFYVSDSLEEAAATRHGPPLAGRRFSVEPPLEERGDVVVARVVERSPEPLGPVVYVSHPSLEVTALRCRCEPSQAEEIPLSAEYRLVPITGPGDFAGAGLPEELWSSRGPEPLRDLLRLPDRE